MGEVRTSFRCTMSRMSRYSRTLSNSSTGRLDRAYEESASLGASPHEDIQVAEDKKVRSLKARHYYMGAIYNLLGGYVGASDAGE